MNLKLISCEVFYREMHAAVARSPHQVDMTLLPKGLHEIHCRDMRKRIQNTLAQVDEGRYDAVLLGYGLCNNGLAGLQAGTIPMVIPRAHDCMTLFFGGKERYLAYFRQNPGVYFQTSGWIERSKNPEVLDQLSITKKAGMDQSFETLVEKYGVDNARYLYDTLHTRRAAHYGQFTFLEMGVEPDDRFEKHTRELAGTKGWKYEKIMGDMSLLQRFLDGLWDDREFLIVAPGSKVVASHDDGIVKSEHAMSTIQSGPRDAGIVEKACVKDGDG